MRSSFLVQLNTPCVSGAMNDQKEKREPTSYLLFIYHAREEIRVYLHSVIFFFLVIQIKTL